MFEEGSCTVGVLDALLAEHVEPAAESNNSTLTDSAILSGASDPYLECELYLQKVNDEIGKVFENWDSTGAAKAFDVKKRTERLARVKKDGYGISRDGNNNGCYVDASSSDEERHTFSDRYSCSCSSCDIESSDSDPYDRVASSTTSQEEHRKDTFSRFSVDSVANSVGGTQSRNEPYFGRFNGYDNEKAEQNCRSSHTLRKNSFDHCCDTRYPTSYDCSSVVNVSPGVAKAEFLESGIECVSLTSSCPPRRRRRRAHHHRREHKCDAGSPKFEKMLVRAQVQGCFWCSGDETERRKPPPSPLANASSAPAILHAYHPAPRQYFNFPTNWPKYADSSAGGTSVSSQLNTTDSCTSGSTVDIEASEACNWLRAAGFPQYAQMYEDNEFPISLGSVQKDHKFLEADTLQALFRRLNQLNRCATQRRASVDHLLTQRKSITNANKSQKIVLENGEDSEDGDSGEIALSENWMFEPNTGRWQRISHLTPPLSPNIDGMSLGSGSGSSGCEWTESKPSRSRSFRRSGSERLMRGAKALLRRVESIKKSKSSGEQDEEKSTRKSTASKHRRQALLISSPLQITDTDAIHSNADPNTSSLLFASAAVSASAILAARSLNTSPSPSPSSLRVSPTFSLEDQTQGRRRKRSKSIRRRNSILNRRQTLSNPVSIQQSINASWKIQPENKCNSDANSSSTDERSPDLISSYRLASSSFSPSQQHVNSPRFLIQNNGIDEVDIEKKDGVEMHRLTVGQFSVVRKLAVLKLTAIIERHCPSVSSTINSTTKYKIASPTSSSWSSWSLPNRFVRRSSKARQLHHTRKSVSGENGLSRGVESSSTSSVDWSGVEEDRDEVTFGVGLAESMGRWLSPLPPPILLALDWLHEHGVDQVGVFRKPGLKSRVQSLRAIADSARKGELLSKLDKQHAYDVADFVKLYFRELPDPLFTRTLSNTLIALFQHVEDEKQQEEGVRCCILLLPDEHRLVLHILLNFLRLVCGYSYVNQMSASNLAVCFAPSLFSWSDSDASPSNAKSRRDADHNAANNFGLQNKAAHHCLHYLLINYPKLFVVSNEFLSGCRFNYMDQSVPVSISQLGSDVGVDCIGYLRMCRDALLDQVKPQSLNDGWVKWRNVNGAEICWQKARDGHELRVWRGSIEVDAPPTDLLLRLIRQRHLFDSRLLQGRLLRPFQPNHLELYRYVATDPVANVSASINAAATLLPFPPIQYTILRLWETKVIRTSHKKGDFEGACLLVETSVGEDEDGAENAALEGDKSVSGLVLASRFYIEPLQGGKSRLLYFSRIDYKGRSVEWYNRFYGFMCAKFLLNIRDWYSNRNMQLTTISVPETVL